MNFDVFEAQLAAYHASLNGGPPVPGCKELLFLRAALQYQPDNVYVLNRLASLAFELGCAGESMQAARKSLAIQTTPEAQEIVDMIHDPFPPPTITLEISTVCTLRCPLCHLGRGLIDRAGRFMHHDAFTTIWDKIKATTTTVCMTGLGESFLNPDIYKILETIDDKAEVQIDTNGNADIDAARLMHANINKIYFSIDGADVETYEKYRKGGNFNRAVKNTRAMVAARGAKRKPWIAFKTVVFSHNEDKLENIKEFARDLGVDEFKADPCVYEPAFGSEYLYLLARDPAWHRVKAVDFTTGRVYPMHERDSCHCTVPMNMIFIDVDGNVGPCCSTFPMPILGNLQVQSLEEIWTSEAARVFRAAALENRYAVPACRRCSFPLPSMGHCFDGTCLEEKREEIPLTATHLPLPFQEKK